MLLPHQILVIAASFCIPMLIHVNLGRRLHAVGVFFNFAFGVAIYAVLLSGLERVGNQECGDLWFLLTIAYAIFHVIFISCLKYVHLQQWWLNIFVMPCACVIIEYLRHLATYAYDGSGLTFASAGQNLATLGQDWICAIGGIWSLTSFVAFVLSLLLVVLGRQRAAKQVLRIDSV